MKKLILTIVVTLSSFSANALDITTCSKELLDTLNQTTVIRPRDIKKYENIYNVQVAKVTALVELYRKMKPYAEAAAIKAATEPQAYKAAAEGKTKDSIPKGLSQSSKADASLEAYNTVAQLITEGIDSHTPCILRLQALLLK